MYAKYNSFGWLKKLSVRVCACACVRERERKLVLRRYKVRVHLIIT